MELSEFHDKSVPCIGCQHAPLFGIAKDYTRKRRTIRWIYAARQWFALPARRRQRMRKQTVGTTCAVDENRLLCTLAACSLLKFIAGFICELARIDVVT